MWKFFNRVMQSLSKGSIIKLFKEWLYIKVLFYINSPPSPEKKK